MIGEKETYKIHLVEFPGQEIDKSAAALAEAFEIPVEKAGKYLERIPVVVKSNLARDEAQTYTKKLLMIGANLQIENDLTGEKRFFSAREIAANKANTTERTSPEDGDEMGGLPASSFAESAEHEAVTAEREAVQEEDSSTTDSYRIATSVDDDNDASVEHDFDYIDDESAQSQDDLLFDSEDYAASDDLDFDAEMIPPLEATDSSPKWLLSSNDSLPKNLIDAYNCPKCGTTQEQGAICVRCGVVFEKLNTQQQSPQSSVETAAVRQEPEPKFEPELDTRPAVLPAVGLSRGAEKPKSRRQHQSSPVERCSSCGRSKTDDEESCQECGWHSEDGTHHCLSCDDGIVSFRVGSPKLFPLLGLALTIIGGGLSFAIGYYYGVITAIAVVTLLLSPAMLVGYLTYAPRCDRCRVKIRWMLTRADDQRKAKFKRSLYAIACGIFAAVGGFFLYLSPLYSAPDMRLETVIGTYSMEVPRTHYTTSQEENTIRTPFGDVTQVVNTATSARTRISLYMMADFTLPIGANLSRPEDMILEDGLNGFATAINAELGRTSSVSHNEFVGLEGDFEANYQGQTIYGRMQVFRFDDDLLLLLYAGLDSNVIGTPIGTAFFNTLTFDRAP